MIADPLGFAEYILGTAELRDVILKEETEKERAREGNDENACKPTEMKDMETQRTRGRSEYH